VDSFFIIYYLFYHFRIGIDPTVNTIFADMFRSTAFILVILLLASSCIPNEPNFEDFRRVELQRLLSNASEKKWQLIERNRNGEAVSYDSCQVARQLIFEFTASASDNDKAYYINPSDSCISVTDTLEGTWFIPVTETAYIPTDTLGISWGDDTTYFLIEAINIELLEIKTIFSDSLSERFIELDTANLN